MGPFTDDKENAISEDDARTVAYIINFELIIAFLGSFGELIHYIEINFEKIDESQGKAIVKMINDRTTESLCMLRLLSCKGTVLDDLKNTFPNVFVSNFSSSYTQSLVIKSDAPNFNALFPNLQCLSIEYTRESDWLLIGDEILGLTNLYVELPKLIVDGLPNEAHVEQLLTKNPQIHTLAIQHSSLHLLKETNEKLPKLRALELQCFSDNYTNYNGDPVSFKHVKFLTIHADSRQQQIPQGIAFEAIQELELYIQPEITDIWIEFINKQINSNISQLEIYTSLMSHEHLINIADNLTQLEKAIIHCGNAFIANEIITFLDKSQLKFVTLKIEMTKTEQNELRKKISKIWKCDVQPCGRRVLISLERFERFLFHCFAS